MSVVHFREWNLSSQPDHKLLIAGPCSAETAEQVLESCQGAAIAGAHLLRAGIWKPRTRPNSFQGVGAEGLPWLVDAGRAFQLPVTTEVASAQHVEQALKAGVHVLWIGARSTANPFTVQSIADALRGVDVPVMIKNPINPDLELWLGAVERILAVGIKRLAVIHRGFSEYRSAPYRNRPMWQIPIELKRRHPDIPVICDPSHICGNRKLLHEVAQQAYDLDFEGLMIETHRDPDRAWSDAQQQVTGTQLKNLLASLVNRHAEENDPDFLANLDALRYDIDRLDQDIIELLATRIKVSQEIGKYKRDKGVTILQLNRWSRIFDSRVQQTIASGLSEDFAREFIQSIHNESIRQQMRIMEEE